jgi:hypothetical protein
MSLKTDEIRLRVTALDTPIHIRVHADTLEAVPEALAEAEGELRSQFDALSAETLEPQFLAATAEVDLILSQGRELEAFRGKKLMKAFYEQHAKASGVSYRAFVYEVAREAARLPRLKQLTEETVRRIEHFVPREAVELLASIELTVEEHRRAAATALLARLRTAREAWEKDGNVEEDFEDLRERMVELVGAVAESADGTSLVRLAAQLGVRSAR